MHGWSAERIAAAAGAELVRSGAGHPVRIDIDSRQAGPGGLFVGLKGVNSDGGAFATQALERGAWGALVGRGNEVAGDGAVLVADNPLLALQHLATAYRRELGATVIGVTGSTGKTSTKDILEALLSPQVGTWATTGNLNTEIGVPMTILAAVPGTAMVVLEMAMRGAGQIAELGAIAEPDVGVIVNVGPVHLELLGSIEAIAATKAELIAALPPSGTAVIPADEPLLESHLRDDIEIVRFGEEPLPDALTLTIAGREPSAHMLANARAAVAAARAAGVEPTGRIDVELSSMRGQRIELADGVVVVNDCYNANPMSMRAALDDLALSTSGRRVAVLGDMLELGEGQLDYHEQIGAHARLRGVDLLVTVGPLAERMHGDHAVADATEAAALMPGLLQPGDTVLIKASRGIGLEAVTKALVER